MLRAVHGVDLLHRLYPRDRRGLSVRRGRRLLRSGETTLLGAVLQHGGQAGIGPGSMAMDARRPDAQRGTSVSRQLQSSVAAVSIISSGKNRFAVSSIQMVFRRSDNDKLRG